MPKASRPRSKPGKPKSEASESLVLVASAFDLARSLGIANMLVLADLLTDRRAVERAREDEAVIWLTHSAARDDYPEIPKRDRIIALPSTALDRLDQVKLGLTLAVLRGHVAVDVSVVCLTGVAGSKRLDMQEGPSSPGSRFASRRRRRANREHQRSSSGNL
jgi:hypothetical protein